ncbi:DUF3667 domain-containing protein [Dokdonia pacifica]|uniref:DUF3667 domain-containing protein n=2 Tax=Dokdonia pacifica TaxID=1627892 RepID=A0A239CL87_9FLAO|nr:DUF3667 domain-containing protein [Dokdonia pacifica]SNS20254.1 Protein of unknown function [Dokdonia pacifica]
MGKVSKRKKELLEVSNVCINCDSPLALDQRFCSNCGGKRMYNRITWRNLFEDFVDRFLNIENAFLRTFLALFKRPEEVIGGYMKGMRKKYLPAFSYFAVALTVAGVYAFIIKHWFLDDMIQAQTSFYDGSATAEFQKSFATKWLSMVMENQSIVYFAIIPVLAVLSKIVFWNYKQYNLVEHFVIYLYGYSHIALITTVLGLFVIWNQTLSQIYGMVTPFVTIAYMAYVLKRLFKLDSGSLVLKTGLFFLIGGVILVLFFIITAIIGVVMAKTGALNDTEFFKLIKKQAEAQKAAKALRDSINGDTLKETVKLIKDSIQ